jgi:hypothetical protein
LKQFTTPQFVPGRDHALAIRSAERVAPYVRYRRKTGLMVMFKANFTVGLLVGVTLAASAPTVGTELITVLSGPAKANIARPQPPGAVAPQTVNRTGKSDRLHPSHNAIGSSHSKFPKIPEGCDAAFSPLSRGAASNFSSRCRV